MDILITDIPIGGSITGGTITVAPLPSMRRSTGGGMPAVTRIGTIIAAITAARGTIIITGQGIMAAQVIGERGAITHTALTPGPAHIQLAR